MSTEVLERTLKRAGEGQARKAPNENQSFGFPEHEAYLARFAEYHQNPLSIACSRADNTLLQMLLKQGFSPNADMNDPLIIACAMRNVEAVTLLLKHGAKPNKRSYAGVTSAVHAAIGKDAQWAVDIRLNPAWRGRARRMSPEHLAIAFELAELAVVRLLAHAGADLGNDLGGFETPLHVAIRDSNIRMQALLLELGADLDTPNYRGVTPRHLLGPELVKVLLAQG